MNEPRPNPYASLHSIGTSAADGGRFGPPINSNARHVVLVFLCLAATIAYIGRNILGVASGSIRDDLDISLSEMGWVMSAFFWSYAMAQIPSGWLGHVRGTRRALTTFALVWSLSCAAMGLAGGLVSLIAAQLLFGMAQAGIFPCSANTISKWIPISRRAFSSGALGSFMSVGGAIGAAMTGFLLRSISWHWVFPILAAPGIVWAAAFYWWFRDSPEEHPGVRAGELAWIRRDRPPEKEKKSDQSTPWLAIVGSFDMWMICGQQFFRAAGYIFYATWFPTYLKETRGVSTEMSGYMSGLPLLGVVIGGLLGGLVVDAVFNATGSRRLSRQGVAITAMLGCAGFILLAYLVEDANVAVLLISLGSLLAALGGSCAYTVTIDKGGQFVAPVFGTMNMSGNFGAALCPIVVAWFVQWTNESWNLVLLLFVGIYLGAALCWVLLNPNGTLFERPAGGSAKPPKG